MKSACPLDCYDACELVIEESGQLKGGDASFTHGHLCRHLHHYHQFVPLQQARIGDKICDLDTALAKIAELMQSTASERTLLFRGSGHVGKMQAVTNLLFNKHKGVIASGSLCDGAGQAGIAMGRGKNYMLTPEQIQKSELVVVWGRNIDTTNTHMLKLLEGKKVIVIDPVETPLAKKADLFIQVRPRGDFYLAMLLSRFAMMEEIEDRDFIEKHSDNFEWYKDFNLSIRIKVAMQKADIVPSQIYKLLGMIEAHKTVFLVGVGVQKYKIGESVLHAIDSLAALLGKIGKEGCGVGFVGDSMVGLEDPFKVETATVNQANIDFSSFDLILFQGSNALATLPNTLKVQKALEGKTVIYFGRDDNETAKRADIVIPTADFRTKEDIRLSYTDNTLKRMPKLLEPHYGISEYDFTHYLFNALNYQGLASENSYIESFIAQSEQHSATLYSVKNRPDIAYAEGFENDEEAFVFIDEYEDQFALSDENAYYFITPKSKLGINTQFKRETHIYLHPESGFKEGEKVCISSSQGAIELPVALDSTLRKDTVCIYAGTPNVNVLTTDEVSEYARAACYQEIEVKVNRC